MAATRTQLFALHTNLAELSAGGSLAFLLGLSGYFSCLEWIAPTRHILAVKAPKKNSLIWLYALSLLLMVGGLVCLALSTSLYPGEKEEVGYDLPTLIQQLANTEAMPEQNDPAIVAGIAVSLIAMGLMMGLRQFQKEEHFGMISTFLLALGWLGLGFIGATETTDLNSINYLRLAWTLPGMLATFTGLFLFPWQIRNDVPAGPCWIIAAGGLASFTVGTSFVRMS